MLMSRTTQKTRSMIAIMKLRAQQRPTSNRMKWTRKSLFHQSVRASWSLVKRV